MKNPHLMEVRPGTIAPVSVIRKGRKYSLVEYREQRYEVLTKNLKKIPPDHLLPS